MVFVIASLALLGLTSGLLLLHWLVLGFIGLVMSMVYLVLTGFDLLLLPRWAAMLALFQMSHLAGAAMRAWSDKRWEERS